MNRYIDLSEVSDGRLYGANDLVKAGCGDCAGCSACCESMADTIVLDPMDICLLTSCLGIPAAELLGRQLELGVVDGVVLPHIKMTDSTGRCPFLTQAGRCGIHAFRPGFCRLFPLGRFYENRGFRYFLQVHECSRPNRTKVRVRRWIDMPDFDRYEKFIADWHYFLRDLQESMTEKDPEWAKEACVRILNEFIFNPYGCEADFYPQFYERLKAAEDLL
ncbi:MAG: YkgJ family cysteine cluster protein [Hungatella sp.]|nr:YkgJ family cysteine cluster protein [Hungatella sp.]